jgi:hypothetical protein
LLDVVQELAASSRIQERLIPVYRFTEVGVPDGGFHNEINRPLEEVLQTFEQSEIPVGVA